MAPHWQVPLFCSPHLHSTLWRQNLLTSYLRVQTINVTSMSRDFVANVRDDKIMTQYCLSDPAWLLELTFGSCSTVVYSSDFLAYLQSKWHFVDWLFWTLKVLLTITFFKGLLLLFLFLSFSFILLIMQTNLSTFRYEMSKRNSVSVESFQRVSIERVFTPSRKYRWSARVKFRDTMLPGKPCCVHTLWWVVDISQME